MRLKSVSTQQEVERSPIGSRSQRYNELQPCLGQAQYFPWIFSEGQQVSQSAPGEKGSKLHENYSNL